LEILKPVINIFIKEVYFFLELKHKATVGKILWLDNLNSNRDFPERIKVVKELDKDTLVADSLSDDRKNILLTARECHEYFTAVMPNYCISLKRMKGVPIEYSLVMTISHYHTYLQDKVKEKGYIVFPLNFIRKGYDKYKECVIQPRLCIESEFFNLDYFGSPIPDNMDCEELGIIYLYMYDYNKNPLYILTPEIEKSLYDAYKICLDVSRSKFEYIDSDVKFYKALHNLNDYILGLCSFMSNMIQLDHEDKKVLETGDISNPRFSVLCNFIYSVYCYGIESMVSLSNETDFTINKYTTIDTNTIVFTELDPTLVVPILKKENPKYNIVMIRERVNNEKFKVWILSFEEKAIQCMTEEESGMTQDEISRFLSIGS